MFAWYGTKLISPIAAREGFVLSMDAIAPDKSFSDTAS
jgi:hypothetical protein